MTLPAATSPPVHRGAEELFRKHGRFVADFAARLGVRSQEIDDVVQEVFLVAHRRGGYVDGPATPTSWLAQITLLTVRTRRRTERRRPSSAEAHDMDTIEAHGASPHEAMAAAQAMERVQQALDAIDLDHRAVFILFEIEQESCHAIAASLGVPIGTVYSRLHAARRRFEEAHDRLGKIEASRLTARAVERIG